MKCEIKSCSPCGTRNFLTKEEKLEMLNEYKEWLDSESKGVAEAMKDMKAS